MRTGQQAKSNHSCCCALCAQRNELRVSYSLPYIHLARLFNKLENESSRLAKIDLVTNCRVALHSGFLLLA